MSPGDNRQRARSWARSFGPSSSMGKNIIYVHQFPRTVRPKQESIIRSVREREIIMDFTPQTGFLLQRFGPGNQLTFSRLEGGLIPRSHFIPRRRECRPHPAGQVLIHQPRKDHSHFLVIQVEFGGVLQHGRGLAPIVRIGLRRGNFSLLHQFIINDCSG